MTLMVLLISLVLFGCKDSNFNESYQMKDRFQNILVFVTYPEMELSGLIETELVKLLQDNGLSAYAGKDFFLNNPEAGVSQNEESRIYQSINEQESTQYLLYTGYQKTLIDIINSSEQVKIKEGLFLTAFSPGRQELTAQLSKKEIDGIILISFSFMYTPRETPYTIELVEGKYGQISERIKSKDNYHFDHGKTVLSDIDTSIIVVDGSSLEWVWKNDTQLRINMEMNNQEMSEELIVPAIDKFLKQLRRDKVI